MQCQHEMRQAAQHIEGGDKFVRKRLKFKQPRPPCYEFALVPKPAPPPEAS